MSLWNVSGEDWYSRSVPRLPPPPTGASPMPGRQGDPGEAANPGAGTSGYGTPRFAGGYGPGQEDAPPSAERAPRSRNRGGRGNPLEKPRRIEPGAHAELTSEELEMLMEDDPGSQRGPLPKRDGPEARE